MIRKATKKDLHALYGLYNYFVDHLIKCRPERYTKEKINQKIVYNDFEKYINGSKGNILVYEERGRVVGYGIGKIEENELFVKGRKHGILYQIVVKEENQNNGIGKALANELIHWMRTKGVYLIYCIVDEKNKESLRVWEKIGFGNELVYISKEI